MPDADLGAERLQIDDAVPFGLVVAVPLARVQRDRHLANLLRWKIVEHVDLLAAQLQLAVPRQQLHAGPVPLRCAWIVVIDELQYRRQLLFVILDGRPCQGPGTRSAQFLERIAGVVPVLDALRLVGYDHIPPFRAHRRRRTAAEIGAQRVVADQGDVDPRRPLPGAIGYGTTNDDGGEFRGPLVDLSAPLIQHAGRRRHQTRRDRSLRMENPQGCNGLYRLAQPHVVGQQQTIAVQQRLYTLLLEGHQLRGPTQLNVPAAAGGYRWRSKRRPQPRREEMTAWFRTGPDCFSGRGPTRPAADLLRPGRKTDRRRQPGNRGESLNPIVSERHRQRLGRALQRLQRIVPLDNLVEQSPRGRLAVRLRCGPQRFDAARGRIRAGSSRPERGRKATRPEAPQELLSVLRWPSLAPEQAPGTPPASRSRPASPWRRTGRAPAAGWPNRPGRCG